MEDKQRIGQWIYNKLRPTEKEMQNIGCDSGSLQYNNIIANRLFNMSDSVFRMYLKEKQKAEYVPIEVCPKHHRQLDSRNKCRDCESLGKRQKLTEVAD